jgi:hypothetical protein
MSRPLAVALFLVAWLTTLPALACAVCANQSFAARPPTKDDQARRFRVTADAKMGEVRAGDTALFDRRLEVALAVTPTEGLELSIDVPALHRTFSTRGQARESALVAGDLELRGVGTLWSTRGSTPQRLALSGALKLPTAPNERDALGRSLSSVLQPGCNAITPRLGVLYALSRGRFGLAASAELLFPVAVRKAPHTSESFRTFVTAEIRPARWLVARSGLSTRYEPSGELYPGVSDPDSGGFVGSLVEELSVLPTESWSFGLASYAPILQALHGRQRVGTTFGATVSAVF